MIAMKRLSDEEIDLLCGPRRMARKGRRLCAPGLWRGLCPSHRGQLFERRGPAARGDAGAPEERGISACLTGSSKKGLARPGPRWSTDDEILEARVRREGVIAAGAVLDARLVAVAPRVTVEAGGEQFLLPAGVGGVTEGARLAIEIMREAIGGSERWKRRLARRTDAAPAPAPPLAERRFGQAPVRRLGRSSRRGAVRRSSGSRAANFAFSRRRR